MRKKTITTILFVLAALNISAQVTVKGQVVNERGETIEYVSIGFEADESDDASSSVGTISDAKGNFTLTIPKGRKNVLSFSHVSYLSADIPYKEYASGKPLTVVLKDKVVELTEVVIGKKNKPKTIVGAGLSVPGGGVVGLSGGEKKEGPEGGRTFSSSKDYTISDILIHVWSCDFPSCTLSINLYEKRDGKFVNILNKPIYETVRKEEGKHVLDVHPEETLLLKRKTHYYISVSLVDSEGSGMIYFKGYIKNGFYRSKAKGKQLKVPLCPAIIVKGYEVS